MHQTKNGLRSNTMRNRQKKKKRHVLRMAQLIPFAEWSSRLYFIHKIICGKLLAI